MKLSGVRKYFDCVDEHDCEHDQHAREGGRLRKPSSYARVAAVGGWPGAPVGVAVSVTFSLLLLR